MWLVAVGSYVVECLDVEDRGGGRYDGLVDLTTCAPEVASALQGEMISGGVMRVAGAYYADETP